MGSPGKATVDRRGYRAYIQSSAWAKVRKRYWASNMPKACFVCGGTNRPMDLHHRTYKNLGNERLMDLVPVHRHCHDRIHDLHNARTNQKIGLWQSTVKAKKMSQSRKPSPTPGEQKLRDEKRVAGKARQRAKKERRRLRDEEALRPTESEVAVVDPQAVGMVPDIG